MQSCSQNIKTSPVKVTSMNARDKEQDCQYLSVTGPLKSCSGKASKDGLYVGSKKTNTPKHFSLVAVSQQGIWYKFLLAEPMLFNPAYFMLATIICRPHLKIRNLEVFPFCLTKISQKQVSFTATLTDVFSNVKYDESVSVFAPKHFCLHWPPTVCTIKYRQKNIMSLISIDRLEKIKALCFISAR